MVEYSELRGSTSFAMHSLLVSSRVTSLLYERARPKLHGYAPTRETDIVIEGFPRSANTYALVAFRHANGEKPRVSHHLHSSASIRYAAAARMPCLLLVRAPLDACASLLQRQPMSPKVALSLYIMFHKRVASVVSGCVVAPFADVVSDFGSIIETVNDRYGTSFTPFVKSAESEQWCRSRIADLDQQDRGVSSPHTVATPDLRRKAGNSLMKERLSSHANMVAEAETLYQRILASRV